MTGLLAVKLRRDLQAAWPRLVLMVVAIVVSLTVFGGVLFTWSASARETTRAYLGTEPASATILLDRGVDTAEMARIVAQARNRPGVLAATGRAQFTTAIEVDGVARDNPLQVYLAAPDDPMQLATFEVRQASWPPAAGELLLGTDTLALLDLAVGDSVTVTLPGGAATPLQVTGAVYDPSLAPAPQEQVGHGYLSTASLAATGVPTTLDQLKIQVADAHQPATASRDRDAIVAVASELGQWLQREQDLAVREIQVPEPYQHPHQGQADSLLLSLLAGGGVALLLSALLVATMLNGLFTQQIPQIGIMKAIGARSARIGRLYLAMTLVVAGVATLVAVPLGRLVGRAGTPAILEFLGIETAQLAPAGGTYLVVLAGGLVLPLLLALYPLVRTSRTTVRAAIDHHGLGATAGRAARVAARLGRLPGLHRGLLMALRNPLRRPARFALAVGLLASAGMVFVAGMSVGDGVAAVQTEAQQQRSWDVDVRLSRPARPADVAALVMQVPGVALVEGLTVTQTGVAGPDEIPVSRTYPDQGHGRVSLVAVPPGTSTFSPPPVRHGRWLEPGEPGGIVLNQVTVANTVPGASVGDTVELVLGGERTSWQVVGIARERQAGGGAYVTAAGLAAAIGEPPQVNQLRVVTTSDDEPTRTAVAAAVDQALTAGGVEVGSAASVSRSDTITEGHLRPIIAIVLAISIAMAVIGCIGLASTMSANILERTRELGVMHAVGARPRTVRRMVSAEGVFLALASCLVAVLPTLALTALLGAGLGNLFMYAPLPFRISAVAAGSWVAVVLVGAVLATDAAATRASRLTVREALTYL